MSRLSRAKAPQVFATDPSEYFKTVVRIGSLEVDMLAPVPFLSLSRDLTKPEPGMTGGFVGRTGGIVRELDAERYMQRGIINEFPGSSFVGI